MRNKRAVHLPTLESLRGLAGFYVFFHHFAHFYLEPKYPGIGRFFPFGQVAVLGFFILSGFVIHYSCFLDNPHLSGRVYFIRRFRRIYPLFLAAMALSYLSQSWTHGAWLEIDSQQLMGNLLMLQDNHFGSHIAPLFGNHPTWSLSYEWYFYLLYFPLAFIVPAQDDTKTLIVGFFAAVGMLVHLFAPNQASLFLIYFPIWWSGAYLARQYFTSGDLSYRKQKSNIFTMAAVVFLWWFLFVSGHAGEINSFTHPYLEMRRLLTGFALLVGTIYLTEHYSYQCARLLKPFRHLGAISYGIYVFHCPVLNLIPTDGEPLLHFLWVLPLTVGLAYFFERILQPEINRLLPAENNSLPAIPSPQP